MSAPADRAAILSEAADVVVRENARCPAVGPCPPCEARTRAATELRSMAVWAQQAAEVQQSAPTDQPRRFYLQRHHDVSGISGTGRVADGILWPDGSADVRWRGPRPSAVHWDRMDDAVAIHGHGGATEIVWIDEAPAEPESAAYARLKAAAHEAAEAAHLHAMRGMRAVYQLCRQHGFGNTPIPAAEVLAALGLDEDANPVRTDAEAQQPTPPTDQPPPIRAALWYRIDSAIRRTFPPGGTLHALIAAEATDAVMAVLPEAVVNAADPVASTAPLAAGLPHVQGRCPACGTAALFLGNGGYITCSSSHCPEPDAASTLLERRPAADGGA